MADILTDTLYDKLFAEAKKDFTRQEIVSAFSEALDANDVDADAKEFNPKLEDEITKSFWSFAKAYRDGVQDGKKNNVKIAVKESIGYSADLDDQIDAIFETAFKEIGLVKENYVSEAQDQNKKYIITRIRPDGKEFPGQPMTLKEAVEYFQGTLSTGKSYEGEKGNKKINMNPKNIDALIKNINQAKNNAAANGYSGTYYDYKEYVEPAASAPASPAAPATASPASAATPAAGSTAAA